MRYVVAVGGNALRSGKVLNKLCATVVALAARGDELVITHGNGPQVGALAMHTKKSLAALTKETQSQIGGQIMKSLISVDRKVGGNARIIYTHVVVSKDDAEFDNPTKPIGEFCSKAEAERLAKRGFVMKHLLKGYRRVVPSPKPRRIVELGKVEAALGEKRIVIAAGGGGIAVTNSRGGMRYVDAVVDKDLASSLLARRIHADRLLILTNVDGVFIGYHTKKSHLLNSASVSQMRRYLLREHFEAGSMLPKVRACIDFVSSTGKYAAIGNLSKPLRAFNLKGATVIYRR